MRCLLLRWAIDESGDLLACATTLATDERLVIVVLGFVFADLVDVEFVPVPRHVIRRVVRHAILSNKHARARLRLAP